MAACHQQTHETTMQTGGCIFPMPNVVFFTFSILFSFKKLTLTIIILYSIGYSKKSL